MLKEKSISDDEYDNSKKFYTLLKMRDLSDLNNLYNAQGVILLLEIMENRFQEMYNKTMHNRRKCNSAGKLSGCVQRKRLKVTLALPTNISIMKIFEKTLIGGLSFNTEFVMPNLTKIDYKKMNIDGSFRAYKSDDLKVIYRIMLDDKRYHKRRIISKILKMDENNQYGFAMTKPMPTGCIKEHPAPSWLKFNLLLKTVDLDDKIGHPFVMDIELDKEIATE